MHTTLTLPYPEFAARPTPRVRTIGPYRLYETRDPTVVSDLEYASATGFDGVVCSIAALELARGFGFRAVHVDRGGSRDPVCLDGYEQLQAVACGDVDLSDLTRLEYAYTGGIPRFPDPAGALRWLSLGSLAWEHLRGLNAPQLQYLRIQKGRLRSLDGLQRSVQLWLFEVDGCNRLVDVSTLAELPSVVVGSFVGCKALDPTGLAYSSVQELALVECGHIASLGFLKSMPSLRVLNLDGTTVEDGDLTPIVEHEGLEQVSLKAAGHYSHSMEDVHAALNKERSVRSLMWPASGSPVRVTAHCSVQEARGLLMGLLSRERRARAALELDTLMDLSEVLLRPGTPHPLTLRYGPLQPKGGAQLEVVFDERFAIAVVQDNASRRGNGEQ